MKFSPIEIKTTGQLIDESTILELKLAAGKNVSQELSQYAIVIAKRLAGHPEIGFQVERLRVVNGEIWKMIDSIYAGDSSHAQSVQKKNEERCKIVREIDQITGQRDTVGKVYQ